MHIKELVLDNFKSFGRKTRIPFYEDFTVVTGPNGSGKSNIIDSVLFALGLARTSGIRAEKLTGSDLQPTGRRGRGRLRRRTRNQRRVILDNADRKLQRSQVINAAGTGTSGTSTKFPSAGASNRPRTTTTPTTTSTAARSTSPTSRTCSQAGVTPEGTTS